MTTEFDRVFDQMEAPEYPATCDNCGETGTNATMEQHECSTERVVTHENQITDYPKGARIEAIREIPLSSPSQNYYADPLPRGTRGVVSAHTDDGRAYINFEGHGQEGFGHTFDEPEKYIRVVCTHRDDNCPANHEQPRPEQAGGEGDESWGNAIADAAERLAASIKPEFERDYYAEFQQQRTAKYPAKILVDLLAAGEINHEQYERLRRESIEHEHDDAPAAPKQHVSWTSVNMTEDPRDPRFTIEEGDKLLATVYNAATAARIITEHNQYSTLIAQRERLLRLLRPVTSPTACYCAVMRSEKCWHCEARELISTIEQEGTR